MPDIPPQTITKEEVLASYNAERGSSLTFAQLGLQLAIRELQAHRRKMRMAAIVDEVII
jgi:hypothetical protein